MLVTRKLLTIVVEASLEQRIAKDLLAGGAKGFTVTSAHGQGPKNQRAGDLEGGNVKIESVLAEASLAGILEVLEKKYFEHYACTVWVTDVQVLRSERY
jgi:nitrogen regulatory protein P-II 2